MAAQHFSPPPGPPPPRALQLPYLSEEDRRRFYQRGWASINLSDVAADSPFFEPSEFTSAFSALFDASSTFFTRPTERKAQFLKATEGSEDGWSRVVGEKELITIRTAPSAPGEVHDQVQRCWEITGRMMLDVIGDIASSLGLDSSAFWDMVEPCSRLPSSTESVATLFRMFRYERTAGKPLGDAPELQHRRVVAERHRDLGLLSLVVGSSPGLEVWDPHANCWYAVEELSDCGRNGLTATLLSGETLARLTNNAYRAGGHRVVVSDTESNPYRFSLVFALRAHHPVPIDTDHFTTPITGRFAHPMKGINAGQLYAQISNSHFNINIGLKERREQEERLRLAKEKGREGGP